MIQLVAYEYMLNVYTQCFQSLKTKGLVIPFHCLTLKDNLGSGAFGIVKKAELFEPGSGTYSTVAVKMLKGRSITAAVFLNCFLYVYS